MIKEIEIWKDVIDYEGLYQVSNLGRIKSLYKVSIEASGGERHLPEKILKPSIKKDPKNSYASIILTKNSIRKNKMIHRLIAESFLGVHKGLVVDHKDNNKINNKLSNLQWISQRENVTKDQKMTSKYNGVSFHKEAKKWESYLWIKGRKQRFGFFLTQEEASERYKKALIEFGVENKFASVV